MATAETVEVDVNSLPLTVDIGVTIGDAYRKLWTLQRDTGTAAAVSLTDVTWTLIISTDTDGTVKLSKTVTTGWTASGIHVDTAASGQFSVYVLAADVATLTAGDYYYEVVATFGSSHSDFPSVVKTLFNGRFSVRPNT